MAVFAQAEYQKVDTATALQFGAKIATFALIIVGNSGKHKKTVVADSQVVDNFGAKHSVACAAIFSWHTGHFIEPEEGNGADIEIQLLVKSAHQAMHVAGGASGR